MLSTDSELIDADEEPRWNAQEGQDNAGPISAYGVALTHCLVTLAIFVNGVGLTRSSVHLGHGVKSKHLLGFPGGAVVENLPANAGDTGSSPGLGRSHMPQSN